MCEANKILYFISFFNSKYLITLISDNDKFMINLIIAYDQIFSDKLTLTTNTFSRASSVFERGEIQILLHGM